jgi:hypothetical protein
MAGERVSMARSGSRIGAARPQPSRGRPKASAKSQFRKPDSATGRRGCTSAQQLHFPIFRDASGRSSKNASNRGTAGMLER